MRYESKQPNIPAELADNLINSLSGLTAIEGDELRRQVVTMLIDHSYGLGYAAGAGAGVLARMRSRFTLAWQDIKLAPAALRERITMIFRDRGCLSHQIFPPTSVIQRPTRGTVITNPVPLGVSATTILPRYSYQRRKPAVEIKWADPVRWA